MTKEKIQNLLILLIIILIGLFFRLKQWPDYLTFDYEKSRDAIASQNIYLNKKLTLLGPTTEVEGIFHGPLYYYLVGFCYFIFKGNPASGSLISFFFNLACIPILFFIGKDLFNRKVGLLAAFLYTISFEAVSYSYWLSNPGPSVPFLFLMFYFFYLFCTKKQLFLIFSLFCLGISIQFQILNSLFIIPLLVMYFVLGKPKIKIKYFLTSVTGILIPLSTFVIFDLKHKFLMTNAFLKNYFPVNKNGTSFSFSPINYLTRITKETSDIFFPTSQIVGAAILVIVFWFLVNKSIKTKTKKLFSFLLIWIFSTLPIFFLNSRIGESSAAFIGISGGIILGFSVLIDQLLPKKKLFFALLIFFPIVLSNLYSINNCLTNSGCRLFDFFEGLFLKRSYEIMDYTYQKTKNNTFQLDTVTSPLYVSTLWDYLFNWYSQKNKLSPPLRENAKIHFLVIEPFVDQVYKDQAIKKKQNIGTLSEERKFGEVSVQEWIID